MKKCKKCGAPLEGFLYNTIGKLMGIKPSATDPEVCNKCAEDKSAPVGMENKPAEATPVAPTPEPSAPVAAPAEEEKKDQAQM